MSEEDKMREFSLYIYGLEYDEDVEYALKTFSESLRDGDTEDMAIALAKDEAKK